MVLTSPCRLMVVAAGHILIGRTTTLQDHHPMFLASPCHLIMVAAKDMPMGRSTTLQDHLRIFLTSPCRLTVLADGDIPMGLTIMLQAWDPSRHTGTPTEPGRSRLIGKAVVAYLKVQLLPTDR